MKRVLVTAFEPYDVWEENSSWLALVRLVRELPAAPEVTTRRYPVDFAAVKRLLEKDLAAGYDVALHLGQAPGSTAIALEMIGLNVGGRYREPDCLPGEAPSKREPADGYLPLSGDGPVAYRSTLPLGRWAEAIRGLSIPARVSYHAGTYLCNATLYWSHYLNETAGRSTQATFVHLPLDLSQTATHRRPEASMPAATCAEAIRVILRHIAEEELPDES